jgi:alkanesulfonate monooxygenase SsuD/methylene tetrahydromethanopterin reductase-like flavin-dependent oxidoreductase (luciferase family)
MKSLLMTSGPCDPTAAADNQYLSSVERRRFARGRADAQTGTAVELHPLVHKTREQALYSTHISMLGGIVLTSCSLLPSIGWQEAFVISWKCSMN